MIKAAVQARAEGICYPVLLGNEEMIEKKAKELELSLDGIEIVTSVMTASATAVNVCSSACRQAST